MNDRYAETDQRIVNTARRLFAEKGILNTEMKDIGKAAGIGRSTLYRLFSCKESILFILAKEALIRFAKSSKLRDGLVFENGYEELRWQFYQMTKSMINHIEDVIFLRDFDVMFTKEFPQVQESDSYEDYVRSREMICDLKTSYERGMMDGSIKKTNDMEFILITMVNGCMAVAQRILPREQVYVKEVDHGREIVEKHLELMLQGIKA